MNISALGSIFKIATTFIKDSDTKKTTTTEYVDKSSKNAVSLAMFVIGCGIVVSGVKSLISNSGSISRPQGGNNRPPKRGGGMIRGISSEQRG